MNNLNFIGEVLGLILSIVSVIANPTSIADWIKTLTGIYGILGYCLKWNAHRKFSKCKLDDERQCIKDKSL